MRLIWWNQAAGSNAVLAAGVAVVTITAPVAASAPGAVQLAAGANTVTITAPVAVRVATRIAPAGAQTVTITAPAATLTVGASTRAAGVQTVTITAPVAVLTSSGGGQTLTAGTNTVTVTAPAATLAPGAVLRAAGTNTVTFTAPVATLTSGAHFWASILDINTRWREYLANLYSYSLNSGRDLVTFVSRYLGASPIADKTRALKKLDDDSKV